MFISDGPDSTTSGSDIPEGHSDRPLFRRPGDDPSIFAIELETLAQRAFIDIDPLIQLQMVRNRFIDGQAECALRRHLDSLGPDTPMAYIVDCCRVGTARLLVTVDQRTRTVGRAVPRPYSDSDDSDNDVMYAEGHDSVVRQVNLRNEWSVDSWTAD